jgi:signal transduction histidine kinase
MLSNRRFNLQQQLTFYPLVCLAVGLLLTFFWMAFLIQSYLDRYLLSQVVAYTQQITQDILSMIDRDQETISAFLLSDTIQDLDHPAKTSIAIERLLSQNKNFLEGYIINLQGKTLVGVSRLKTFYGELPDFRDQKIFREAIRDRVGVSGWENFTENYRPYWYMAVPIEKYPGRVMGVLIVTIDLRRIEDEILTSEGAKYGTPVLIDHRGIVLVDLDRSKLGSRWKNNEITRKVLKGAIGTASYNDEKGKYVLAAYQPLNPYGWGLIVQVAPEQTIYMIRNKVILFFGVMTLAMFLITGLLTYMAVQRIIKPIKELTQATQKLGQKQILEYKPIDGEDEIAQLSAAFYLMAISLRDFEKQRAQYLSMIAHDLRNPLTAIKGFLQELPGNNENGNENVKIENLDIMKRKMEQVYRMINDLLEFSRLDLGQVGFIRETVSVKFLCQDVIAGYREQSHKFILEPFSEEICVWADPIRLQQILQNILDNSLKYTPLEKVVRIDCKTSQNSVQVIISDTGSGIPPELLPDLFTPFRTNPVQKEGSFGLGLAIAKKLAAGMNGDITVESNQGRGTSFTLSLPGSN